MRLAPSWLVLRTAGGVLIALSILGCATNAADGPSQDEAEALHRLTGDIWRAAWFLSGVLLLGCDAIRGAIARQRDR